MKNAQEILTLLSNYIRMKSFASDNNSGVHPQIMEAILNANKGHAIGYGDDNWTALADKKLQKIFGEDVQPYYVFNGTGSNMVALQALTLPFHSILCAATAHINVDECGAPAKFTGCMIKEIPTTDGKLSPELIRSYLHGFGDQHHSQPKVIYISQTTEMGTIYTPEETKAICRLAHEHGMFVHMDGARLANASAKLGVGLRELSRDCGVDILSFGGTKNGMMLGEAVIAFRPELQENLKFYRKQSAQLYSKMRYISCQFTAYLQDDLWLENAKHANEMADYLAYRLSKIPDIRFIQKVESNALFLTMPGELIPKLQQAYFFYVWNEERNEVRLVTSWDTNKSDIDEFVKKLVSLHPQK